MWRPAVPDDGQQPLALILASEKRGRESGRGESRVREEGGMLI